MTRRRIETLAAALVAVAVGIVGLSSGADVLLGPKFVVLKRVARVEKPIHLAQPSGPGSHLFVVEKDGRVRVITNERLQRTPFLDIRRSVKSSGKGDEQGLLSIAFSPDYAETGLFYVAYTDRRDALRVVEFSRSAQDPLVADPTSARVVMRIPQPTTKHHGGLLLFGPDGHLYIGSGDGGPSGDPQNVSQDKRMLRGKILRIEPRPGPRPPRKAKKGQKGKGARRSDLLHRPEGQPYVKRPGRDEIWAYGLRNPGDSPSIGPLGRSRSATSGTTATRRSTTCRPGRRAARTSAGRPTRIRPVHRERSQESDRSARARLPARTGLRRHRRLHSPRLPARADPRARDLRPLPVRRLLLRQALRLPAAAGAPARKAAELPLQGPYLTSFGQDNEEDLRLTEKSLSQRQADARLGLPARSPSQRSPTGSDR
jgi:hypothetical protein